MKIDSTGDERKGNKKKSNYGDREMGRQRNQRVIWTISSAAAPTAAAAAAAASAAAVAAAAAAAAAVFASPDGTVGPRVLDP